MNSAILEKKQKALTSLRNAGSVVVAFSGGVDSAVLLSLAVEALGGDRVLAVTGRSASLPRQDETDARDVAAALGVPHLEIDPGELEIPEYRANTGDRCYHCRSALFESLGRIAAERGFQAVAYGAIAEDCGDFRPGMRAAEERRVIAPLLEAGMSKEDVRVLAAAAGLKTKDKPASACLSSRIPIGIEVTEERLGQVSRAEESLREIGFRQFRVRHHGDIARLEFDPDGDRRLSDPATRSAVVAAVKQAGFRFVTLDLEGYRTGSLNPVEVST
jgi:uncharacterized protein